MAASTASIPVAMSSIGTLDGSDHFTKSVVPTTSVSQIPVPKAAVAKSTSIRIIMSPMVNLAASSSGSNAGSELALICSDTSDAMLYTSQKKLPVDSL